MSSKITGGCLCGAVKYEVQADPVFAGHCYCRDCQRASGAGHVSVAAFPSDAVKIKGKLASFSNKADSGATITRRFCGTCGSRLFAASENMPTLTMIQAGTFDDPARLVPQMGVYEKRRLAWDHKDAGIPCFPEMPPQG